MSIKKSALSLIVLLTFIASTGCTPEVGTEAWCDHMKEKSKADWTANEAGDYAEHCLF
jgi:hypothetical protein